MKLSKTLVLALLLVAQWICLSNVEGQIPFRRSKPVAVAPKIPAAGELSDGNGPWLIMVASFVGEEGAIKAKHLAGELTKTFETKTFIYRQSFDFSSPIQGHGWERVEVDGELSAVRPKQLRPQGAKEFDEYAVLIGEFPTVEDARAQRALESIKNFNPESIGQLQADRETQTLRGWRAFADLGNNNEVRGKGPLRAAFLMPNPLLPDDFFKVNQLDDFVINLNKRAKHSLLENSSTYSVRVATFRGTTTFKLDEMEEEAPKRRWGSKKKSRSNKLVVAAEKAHRLTLELRKLKVEAYEFHDRYESYECVGGFDWVAQGQGEQKTQNPDVVAVIQNFKATIETFPGMPRAVRPKVLPSLRGKGIVFDVQPLPVKVPKIHVSAASSPQKSWSPLRK